MRGVPRPSRSRFSGYHLEHHLYPKVPHQNWKRLARRLDPHFREAGLEARRVFPAREVDAKGKAGG